MAELVYFVYIYVDSIWYMMIYSCNMLFDYIKREKGEKGRVKGKSIPNL